MRRGRTARGRAGAAAALMALVLVGMGGWLAGCGSHVTGVMAGNKPPQTTIWVTGDLDTVGHYQHIYWDGQDPDGQVVGFEFRWEYAPGAAPPGYDPNRWFFTTAHDSLFTVWSPDGIDYPVLFVRAVDDKGARDESPAVQRFGFTNRPPAIELVSTPPDTTLPVAAFGWEANDPDGNVALATFRVTLDHSDRDTIVAGSGITLPPSFFADANGQIEARQRTAYVACIDDGGRMSLPDSFTWVIRNPVGTTLLVDDYPAASGPYDAFYRSELDNRVGAGNYTIVDLGQGAYLSTADAIRLTFGMFQNVFWYSEANPTVSPVLRLADQPIRDYLSTGGNLFITSLLLIGSGGALDTPADPLGATFANDVLGISTIYNNQVSGTTGFLISSGQFLIGGAAPFDTLRAMGGLGGIEAFELADPGDAAYVAPPGTLDTLHVDNWPVAVSRHYGAGQGRIVYLGFPLRLMNNSFSGHPGRAAVELEKVFDLFGVH